MVKDSEGMDKKPCHFDEEGEILYDKIVRTQKISPSDRMTYGYLYFDLYQLITKL